jgi:hypothetical protein
MAVITESPSSANISIDALSITSSIFMLSFCAIRGAVCFTPKPFSKSMFPDAVRSIIINRYQYY